MQFGNHTPFKVNARGAQSAASAFARGLQTPGKRWTFEFPNGFGASVINDGYGGDRGLYEVAVMQGGRITYETPLTDDVLGYLTADEVTTHLDQIEALTVDAVAENVARKADDERRPQIPVRRVRPAVRRCVDTLPMTTTKVSPDQLWQTYLRLDTMTHAYLAGMLAEHLIQSDPERFAQFLAEAGAAA